MINRYDLDGAHDVRYIDDPEYGEGAIECNGRMPNSIESGWFFAGYDDEIERTPEQESEMRYQVRNESRIGRRGLLTRKPLPDVSCYRVIRGEDGAIMETYASSEDASARVAELNRRDQNWSLEDSRREMEENGDGR